MIRKRVTFLLLVVTVCGFVSFASAQTRFKFKTVTRTDRRAPVPSTLAVAATPALNDSRQIALAADGGVFLKNSNKLSIVAALRTPAPGGGDFISTLTPAINAQGQIVFRGAVTTPSRSGLFLFSNGQITQLVSDGQIAPSGDVLVATFPAINAAGDVVFVSTTGLFRLSGGVVTSIANRGAPAPGGGTFVAFTLPTMNQSGQVAFTASLSGGKQGVFLASGGTIIPVAITGTAAPTGGTFFNFTQGVSLNDSGQVAFAGLVNGSGPSGAFLFSNGQVTLQVPTFSSVPGGTLSTVQGVSLNNAGQIAFFGQTFESQGNLNVYLMSGGTVSAVMLAGQTSPEGNIFTSGFNPIINNQGDVAFLARTNISANTVYLFANNLLTHAAGQGDRVHTAARFRGATPFALTDDGQVLLFGSTFPGGNGLFLASTGDDDDDEGEGTTLVVHQGDLLPGGGALLNILNNFSMNNDAQVAFTAGSTANSNQIVEWSGGTLTKIALGGIGTGDPAPGGGTFFNFNSPSINNLNQVVFPASVIGGSAPMVLSSNGQLSSFIDGGQLAAAGLPSATLSAPSFNDQGQAAFFVQPFPLPNGIFLFSQGTFTSIARNGDPAPGGGNFVLSFPNPRFGPVINNNGDVAFAASLSTGGSGVFLFSNGTLIRIAATGDTEPSGNIFLSADSPSLNSAGQVAFIGNVNANGFSAFLYSNGVIVKVARPGDRVPGPGQATLISADSAKLNSRGQVAFVGGLSNGESAVFIARPVGHDDEDPGDDAPAFNSGEHRRGTRNGDPEDKDTDEGSDDPRPPDLT